MGTDISNVLDYVTHLLFVVSSTNYDSALSCHVIATIVVGGLLDYLGRMSCLPGAMEGKESANHSYMHASIIVAWLLRGLSHSGIIKTNHSVFKRGKYNNNNNNNNNSNYRHEDYVQAIATQSGWVDGWIDL
jgi:hypothetical protein